MSLFQSMKDWARKHNPKWLVLLRVALGLGLFIKGFGFIENSVLLSGIIAKTTLIQNAPWLIIVIPWLHILGGIMIIGGLFIRFWTMLHIPVVLGAVIFVNARSAVFEPGSEMLFSIIVLILLFFFFVEGGGPLSLDHYFRKATKK